jgi:hypothetical protein
VGRIGIGKGGVRVVRDVQLLMRLYLRFFTSLPTVTCARAYIMLSPDILIPVFIT